jgi:type 1 glutamine amidotransferase
MSASILTITGGHSVDLDAFRAMIDDISAARGWRHAHAVQPSAQRWIDSDTPFDAILCHDVPGLFLKRGEPPRPIDPPPEVQAAVGRFLASGKGLVILHHALAGWPSWDGWADAIGGRFNYAPGPLHGQQWPSSGTRITDYTAQVVAPDHPVCAGVDDFVLHDELYCCPVFENRIVPLVRSDADFAPERFISTYEHVIVGEDQAPSCAGHEPPSNVIAWATSSGPTPIVFVQPGDSAQTFGLQDYRRLLGNALGWVSSAEARSWAQARAPE